MDGPGIWLDVRNVVLFKHVASQALAERFGACGARGWQQFLLPIVLLHTCAAPGGTGFHGFS